MRSRSVSTRVFPLVAAVLLGSLITGLFFLITSQPRGQPVVLLPLPTPRLLRVHVDGSVVKPGVYEFEPGSIVEDAIQSAGGFQPDAKTEHINLASELHDGQQLQVPAQGDEAAASSDEDQRVHVNSASAPQLERLPGIGPVLAENIVEHRQRYGPFQRPEDLLEVDGIGPSKLESIADLIVVP
jgi:competence protein ComEA